MQPETITLRHLAHRRKLTLLEVKVHLSRHKQHGVLFYPDENLDLLQMDDEIELYMALHPLFSCRHAFPVSHWRYRHFQKVDEQIAYLRERYEAYYEESSSKMNDDYFEEIHVYAADEFIWFYK